MKHKTRKLFSIFLALVMVLGLAPTMSLTAQAAGTNKAIQLVDHSGTTSVVANIEGGQKSAVYFGTYKQSPDGSGDFNKDPIKWRVLSNAEGELFLLSDQNLDVVWYHNDFESVTWEISTMRSWLNGYEASENNGDEGGDVTANAGIDYSGDNFIKDAFAAEEQTAIASTNVVNDNNPDNNTTDKVFLLSIDEAGNSGYGFTDGNSCISTNTAYVAAGGKIGGKKINGVGEGDYWWLRSSDHYNPAYAYGVSEDGDLEIYSHDCNLGVRPAFHLNLESVLFTSAALGGKAGTTGALSEIGDDTENEWKLTLKDESRKFEVTENAASGTPGGTVKLHYKGATVKTATAPNEYISAILTDKNDNLLYYGRLTQPSATDGEVDVKIPADLAEGEYTLKVFSEQYNGGEFDANFTDYASEFDDVTLTVENTRSVTVTFAPNGGKVNDLDTDTATTDTAGKLAELPTPTRSGSYSFEGWYTELNGGEKVDTSYIFEKNTTIYAHWKNTGGSGGSVITKYTLTYNTNGGNTITATRHDKNATVNLTATPTREGYDFTGWYADKELKNAVTSVKMDGNKTVYAGWKAAGAEVDTPVEEIPLLVVTINSTAYRLNGKPMTMDSAPFIDGNNRIMLPVRVIANALDITNDNIKWDSATKTAYFTREDGKIVSCTVNSNVIQIGDEKVTIDTAPVIRNNRIYLPKRALFNAFDVPDENIIWDAAARTVTVTKKD